jgi:hypothetical protein
LKARGIRLLMNRRRDQQRASSAISACDSACADRISIAVQASEAERRPLDHPLAPLSTGALLALYSIAGTMISLTGLRTAAFARRCECHPLAIVGGLASMGSKCDEGPEPSAWHPAGSFVEFDKSNWCLSVALGGASAVRSVTALPIWSFCEHSARIGCNVDGRPPRSWRPPSFNRWPLRRWGFIDGSAGSQSLHGCASGFALPICKVCHC